MIKIRFKDDFIAPTWIMEKSCSIGSSDNNHLTLKHPSVDPLHAKILNKGDHVIIKKTASAPVLVNGAPVTQQSLICHDVVALGDVTFEVIDPTTELEAPNATRWSLIADSNWLTGQEFKITAASGSEVIIGRNAQCDITFPGTHLSRQHASILVQDDHLILTDLKSANGTFVNEQRVKEPTQVRAGDRVRFDVYSFRIFGVGLEVVTNQASRPRATDPIKVKPIKPAPNHPKEWKVRPTSPGNRDDAVIKKREATISWTIAIGIVIGFCGLVAYLFTR